ncbi:hypothetical protein Q9L58_009555, partial [Maublancomyces gigas]
DKPVKPLSDVSLKWGILAKLLIRALDPVFDAFELDFGDDVDALDISKSIAKPEDEYEDED